MAPPKERVPGNRVEAVKSVARRHADGAAAPAGFAAFRIGDAGDGERRRLRPLGPRDQNRGVRFGAIVGVEVRRLMGDFALAGETAIGVLGHRLGHGYRPMPARPAFRERRARQPRHWNELRGLPYGMAAKPPLWKSHA